MRRAALAACSLAALVALAGCERGCLSRQLAEVGVGRDPGVGPPGPRLGVGEVDCPDGLARCVGGVVETSVLGQRPVVCHGSPEACACPWTVASRCPGLCVADGVELAVPQESAAAQLCGRGADDPPYARPADGQTASAPNEAEREACAGGGFRCVARRVVRCESSSAAGAAVVGLVGTCLGGCGPDTAIEAVGLTGPQALALLCSRIPR